MSVQVPPTHLTILITVDKARHASETERMTNMGYEIKGELDEGVHACNTVCLSDPDMS